MQSMANFHRAPEAGRRRLRSGLLAAAGALALWGFSARSGVGSASPETQVAFLGSQMRNVSALVKEGFPGADKGQVIASRALKAARKYGVRSGNTIYATSICSDEINGDKGHAPAVLSRHFGRTFPMGGIGGAPYVGKTGFGAFSHHVPDDGHVFVIFGPHIGFSMDGQASKFLRDGQASISTACGAVVAAYQQCSGGMGTAYDRLDAQQSWLRSKLASKCSAVSRTDNPMVALIMEAYKAVEEEMLAIVNTGYGSGNLVLLGGIQINMPYPMNGFFMPLHFSVRSEGKAPEDLMSAFD